MQFVGLWSLNHDLTTSFGLCHALNFPKIHPHLQLQRWNSIRVHPYAHPQHIKVLRHFVYLWYRCRMQFVGLWSLNHDLTTTLGLRNALIFPKIHLPAQVKQCKCAPMCPPKTLKGAKTLWLYMIWMWDVFCEVSEHQPWPYNITWTLTYL